MKKTFITLLSSTLFLLLSSHANMGHADEAKEWGKDVAKGQDHPLIKRFTGSWLTGYLSDEWNAATIPVSAQLDKDRKIKDSLTLEGKITRLIYLAPRGKVPLEVYRNYEQALKSAGLKTGFSCENQCSSLYSAWSKLSKPTDGLQWANGSIYTPDGSRYSHYSALSEDKGLMLYGTLKNAGQEVHVLLYTSVAAYNVTGLTATFLQIIEPKAMQTGQVSVDANAIKAALQTEGEIALYGLFFDTGKALIKADSKAQLDEMAKLMQAQTQQKYFIVGHTDNVGNFDSNLTLSLQRALAVVAALSAAPYKIDASRMTAKGNANLAPVASNNDEAGRARNRRVEMVVQ
ncbi:OmpA family protein [Undibacterium flavidum]|uniref:OmpA family protein n=1 Tax=Undibacterium flavidum TaxID=2762297 RepID=A0ABR6YA85_9BURK|nr:OmpA family protein [Undibacterium flavidum]MBC3873553.1 OmpA family protein [Undibacterium flavidum]